MICALLVYLRVGSLYALWYLLAALLLGYDQGMYQLLRCLVPADRVVYNSNQKYSQTFIHAVPTEIGRSVLPTLFEPAEKQHFHINRYIPTYPTYLSRYLHWYLVDFTYLNSRTCLPYRPLFSAQTMRHAICPSCPATPVSRAVCLADFSQLCPCDLNRIAIDEMQHVSC